MGSVIATRPTYFCFFYILCIDGRVLYEHGTSDARWQYTWPSWHNNMHTEHDMFKTTAARREWCLWLFESDLDDNGKTIVGRRIGTTLRGKWLIQMESYCFAMRSSTNFQTTLSVWRNAMELQMRLFVPEEDPAKCVFKQLCNQPGWDATIKPAVSDMTINPGYKYWNRLQLFGGFGIWKIIHATVSVGRIVKIDSSYEKMSKGTV